MKKNIRAVMMVAAIALVCGANVYKAKKTHTLSDVALANIEALAQEPETGDQLQWPLVVLRYGMMKNVMDVMERLIVML